MSPVEIGIVVSLLMLVLLVSSMPVAFVLALTGGLGFAILRSPRAAYFMMSGELFSIFSKYSLTVIPLFVFMGQIAFHCGISRRLFDAAYRWLGPLPGGLAMATVGACTGFGAICGSGPATAATMASVALPEMRRYGYDMELGSGAVAAGGSLGMLIPPSVVFIVYAIMTEQSIGKLFIAGILPGLLIAVMFCLTIYLNCVWRPGLGPAAPASSWRQRFQVLLGVGETVILFTAVIGGMFAGVFTPTEAAAIGAAGSLVIALVRRKLSIRVLVRSLQETVRTSCMVLVIVAGAMMFGRFLATTDIPAKLATTLANLPMPGWVIMGVIIAFYLVAGCFVDALALILLTIPIFYPVVTELGYDPIWFGVIIVVVTQMGVISPPVGVNAYVVSGIERDIPLQTVFKGALPFLGALVLSTGLLLMFPEICLILPNQGLRGLLLVVGVAVWMLIQGGTFMVCARALGIRVSYGGALVAACAKVAAVVLASGLLVFLPHGDAAAFVVGSVVSVLLIWKIVDTDLRHAAYAWCAHTAVSVVLAVGAAYAGLDVAGMI